MTNVNVKAKAKVKGSGVLKQNYGTGRRKTCCARVYLRKGTGKITVNDRGLEEYFGGRRAAHMIVRQPFALLELNNFDVFAKVAGGGHMGQAAAIRHGLTRALIQYDEEGTPAAALGETEADSQSSQSSVRGTLKKAGFTTRDARSVERKKFGRRKARKVRQFSKR